MFDTTGSRTSNAEERARLAEDKVDQLKIALGQTEIQVLELQLEREELHRGPVDDTETEQQEVSVPQVE